MTLLIATVVVAGCGASQPGGQPHAAAVASRSAVGCDRVVTPSTFFTQVSDMAPGQKICLESGDYGLWEGTDKQITIAAVPGSRPTMQVDFGPNARGFTLTGMSAMGGNIRAGAANITISDSSFASTIDIEGTISDIVLKRDHFDWKAVSTPSSANAKIFVDVQGTLSAPALTIKDSTILNGDLDGVHIGGGSGVEVVGNEFGNLCDRNVNHTDNIQLESGTQIRIAENYVHEAQSCPTQGITSYDGGTNGLVIEDNVVDIPRDWGIELYSDQNSIVRHNTVVWHPPSYSEFHTGTGRVDIDRKSQDPAGFGTRVYDNIATSVDFSNGSTGSQYSNISGEGAKYVKPSSSWAGFKLSPDSPVGLKAASDGLDDGARIPARAR